MTSKGSRTRGYALAALLGAIGGGFAVAVAIDAVPRMMFRLMAGMMRNMTAGMGEGGFDPPEM